MRTKYDHESYLATKTAVIGVVWTALVAILFGFGFYLTKQGMEDLAVADARARFESTMAFRNWVAGHGGVYVPVTPSVPPNTFLKVDNREILTPSGTLLTLMNPAYAVRHIVEKVHKKTGIYGHLVSHHPKHDVNIPDAWEDAALTVLDGGASEFFEIVDFKDELHLRFMQPLQKTKGCVKCHVDDGIKVGGVVGAISFAQPMKSYLDLQDRRILWVGSSYSILWLAGIAVILTFSKQLRRRFQEQEELAVELVEARDKAQAASAAKSEFLANISHELRTPLNGLLGMLKLLRSESLEPRQQEYAEIAMASGDSLSVVIGDVLDYSRAESGMLRLATKEFNVSNAVENALGPYIVEAERKGLEFNLKLDDGLNALYCGDKIRFQQLLTHLVGNAVKFTGDGSVTVEACPVRKDEEEIVLLFSVSDTGIGIEMERIPYLFEPFTQEDGSRARMYGGVGIGLGIVKRLVEAMGGNVFVESEVDEGSTFHFSIKLGNCNGVPKYGAEEVAAVVMRILTLCDDDEREQQICHGLVKMGNRVTVVPSVEEFVDELRHGEFDCLLCDGTMSQESLTEFASRMKMNGYCSSQPCSVVLVGDDVAEAENILSDVGIQCLRPEDETTEKIMFSLVECMYGI